MLFFAQLQITGFSSKETNNIKSHRWQPRETKICCNLLLIIFSLLVHNGDKVCSCLSSSQLRRILPKTRCLEMFLHVDKMSLISDKMCRLYKRFASCFSLYRLAPLNITSPKLHLLIILLHLLKDCLIRMEIQLTFWLLQFSR